jgi:hypothetical protein
MLIPAGDTPRFDDQAGRVFGNVLAEAVEAHAHTELGVLLSSSSERRGGRLDVVNLNGRQLERVIAGFRWSGIAKLPQKHAAVGEVGVGAHAAERILDAQPLCSKRLEPPQAAVAFGFGTRKGQESLQRRWGLQLEENPQASGSSWEVRIGRASRFNHASQFRTRLE